MYNWKDSSLETFKRAGNKSRDHSKRETKIKTKTERIQALYVLAWGMRDDAGLQWRHKEWGAVPGADSPHRRDRTTESLFL